MKSYRREKAELILLFSLIYIITLKVFTLNYMINLCFYELFIKKYNQLEGISGKYSLVPFIVDINTE